ncbi:MAG: AraC family transcriptional regulator [Chlorobi bacterium]|nr:AraC family transcriptional regulator [Chlorobiota bacterium]
MCACEKQPLKKIAHNLGFESTDYFYRLFKQKTHYNNSKKQNLDSFLE